LKLSGQLVVEDAITAQVLERAPRVLKERTCRENFKRTARGATLPCTEGTGSSVRSSKEGRNMKNNSDTWKGGVLETHKI